MANAEDLNAKIAGLLRDLAAVQKSQQSKWGYKRAASAIRNLDEPIESYLQPNGTLRKIQHVGPSSTRVILEVLQTGESPTVAEAIKSSGQTSKAEQSRMWRQHFLTRSRVLAALSNASLTGPTRAQYRGDLQMHSTWSDGSQSLEDIVNEAIARGYAYCAVTDHSYGLPIAGGLSMERFANQHRDIDALNERYAGRFRLLKGVEANIRGDGTVDMSEDELRRFEIVVAAPHAALRSPHDQTGRMIDAVRTPGVHILGHPRGRMYGSRPGVTADWPKVFAAAKRAKVAIEIDGDPSRQDIDYTLAKDAVAAGCLFALDTDAHGTLDFNFIDTAIAHARLAGVPAELVVNTWALDRLLKWARSR
ncbi:MAG TPA: PHP domain-containing protein [Vicinamibacterales bacterium]|nr:PHP domain-containing protein [Vicinamibacterales bacterium]